MCSFCSFVPEKSNKLLQRWVEDLNVDVRISSPRATKLGDFKVRDNRMIITINNNLNKYSFLITLTHELAHAFAFKQYRNTLKPHCIIWKSMFKSLMLNFLTLDFFPEVILQALSRHIINPKASTFSDLTLLQALRRYDQVRPFTLSDLAVGDLFKTPNGKVFLKGKRIRKRYQCIECKTDKIYLFHPFSEVIKEQ